MVMTNKGLAGKGATVVNKNIGLKNPNGIKCGHCFKVLDLHDVKYINGLKFAVKCINCGSSNFLKRRPSQTTGQRVTGKVKMSKKERLRLRKENN